MLHIPDDPHVLLDYLTRLNDRLEAEVRALQALPPPAHPLTDEECEAIVEDLMRQWRTVHGGRSLDG